MSDDPVQGILEWPPAARLDGADFVVTEANRAAAALVDAWPNWPGPGAGKVLAIAGAAGSGKSHLAQRWLDQRRGARIAADALADPALIERLTAGTALLIDPVPVPLPERALLHLINLVHERGAFLLLVGEDPPSRWPAELPDLASRLAALPVAALAPPDDALLRILLLKAFSDRQIRIDATLLDYLVRRIERSGAAARAIAARLDRHALASGRGITLAWVRSVLDAEPAP